MVKNPNVFQIGIKILTKERLEKLMHPGQSWDGVITELLDKNEYFNVLVPRLFEGYTANEIKEIEDSTKFKLSNKLEQKTEVKEEQQ